MKLDLRFLMLFAVFGLAIGAIASPELMAQEVAAEITETTETVVVEEEASEGPQPMCLPLRLTTSHCLFVRFLSSSCRPASECLKQVLTRPRTPSTFCAKT